MNSRLDSDRLHLLHRLGLAFAGQLDLDALVSEIVQQCSEALDAEGCSIVLADEAREELYFPYSASHDPKVAEQLARLRFPISRGIAGTVFESGESVRVDDVARDVRFNPDIDRQTGRPTRNLLCAPLAGSVGRTGVIQVVNRRNGASFSDADLEFLRAIGGLAGIALDNARLMDAMKSSAERLQVQVGTLRRDLERRSGFGDMIGSAPAMQEVFDLLESAAPSPITVLIEGETGVGKELVARALHRAGPRAEEPFIAINCAALPETLLESELFGHRRGAFTGADRDRVGLIESADRGTVFLDEIGEMPLPMQAKLLRVLQEGELTRIGDVRPRKIDVRVVAATNRHLEQAAEDGEFRKDLFYRLAAFPIYVPPLRSRREDIPLLATRFLDAAKKRQRKDVSGFSDEAIDLLTAFAWPGNVRELENEIGRAVTLAKPGDEIQTRHLSSKLSKPRPGESDASPDAVSTPLPSGDTITHGGDLREARADFEARFVRAVFEAKGGNVSQAARALGLSRVMLQKKLRQLGLR